MKFILIIIFAVMLASVIYNGCGSSAIDMNAKTEYPKGRSLFVSKCNGCHQLYSPEKFDSLQWTATLQKMQKKAAITDIEKEQILLFLTERPDRVPK